MTMRRYTLKLYPTPTQERRMLDIKGACCRLYNRLLEEQKRTWDEYKALVEQGASVERPKKPSCYDMQRRIIELQSEVEELVGISSRAVRSAAQRLDFAFTSFFRNVAASKAGKVGVKAGYPRFKPFRRYPGWGYGDGAGWALFDGEAKRIKRHEWPAEHDGRVRRVYLKDVGAIRCRGTVPVAGKLKTLDILHKSTGWYASVVVDAPEPICHTGGTRALGIDWGLKTFATVVDSEGCVTTIDNPRHALRLAKKLAREQRRLARRKKGSNRRKRQVLKVARVHEKVRNARNNFLHETSTAIVKMAALVAVEHLESQKMTASGGARKKGLNRSILDAAPRSFHEMLKYKAEAAGAELHVIETRAVKPTQTCSGCGAQEKKTLAQRRHACAECGLDIDRDVNAATVILSQALFDKPNGLEARVGPTRSDARGEQPSGHSMNREPSRTRTRHWTSRPVVEPRTVSTAVVPQGPQMLQLRQGALLFRETGT